MITVKVKPIGFEEERIDQFEITSEQDLYEHMHTRYPRDEQGMQRRLLVRIDVNDLASREFICGGDTIGKTIIRHVERIVAMHYIHNLFRR